MAQPTNAITAEYLRQLPARRPGALGRGGGDPSWNG
jgi:hypothetical protein